MNPKWTRHSSWALLPHSSHTGLVVSQVCRLRSIALLFFIAVLYVSPLWSFAGRDILGWQTLRWGMTEAEVQSALNLAIPPEGPTSRDDVYRAFLVPMTIREWPYQAAILFDFSTRRLVMVRLVGQGVPVVRFRALLADLIEKYDSPVEVPGLGATYEWRYPTTTIRLSAIPFKDGSGITWVEYQSTDRADRNRRRERQKL